MFSVSPPGLLYDDLMSEPTVPVDIKAYCHIYYQVDENLGVVLSAVYMSLVSPCITQVPGKLMANLLLAYMV
jgi:hypothetical protein